MFSKHLFRVGLVLVAGLAFSSLASAQATRTWVSGVGDDANPCSRTAPCKTFAGAISKTAANGEINVLDPGGFGGVTITKSITIDGGGFIASALVSGTNAIVVNGANVVVVLRNIQLQGLNTGLDGVRFLQGKSLTLENVRIQQFNGTNGDGIEFAPSSGTSTLTIKNSIISHSGGTTGHGILIKPTLTGNANAVLDNVLVTQNRKGLRAENNSTVTVTNSGFNSNTVSGIEVASVSSGNVLVNLDTITANNNGTNGILSTGSANAFVLLSNSSVFANGTGLARVAGGQILSFQNNRVGGNGTDGSPNGNLNQF